MFLNQKTPEGLVKSSDFFFFCSTFESEFRPGANSL